mgnify:CR=1 FL=1
MFILKSKFAFVGFIYKRKPKKYQIKVIVIKFDEIIMP